MSTAAVTGAVAGATAAAVATRRRSKAVLVSTIGTTPAVVVEAYNELAKRGVEVGHVIVLPTKSGDVEASYAAVKWYFSKHCPDVSVESMQLEFEDIRKPEDCKTFRVAFQKALKTAVKRAGGEEGVHVCLAGGRKTMPIDALLVSMAMGITNVYHVIAEKIPGVDVQISSLTEEERRALVSGEKLPEELERKLKDMCNPPPEKTGRVYLIRIPIPRLSEEERRGLREQLLG